MDYFLWCRTFEWTMGSYSSSLCWRIHQQFVSKIHFFNMLWNMFNVDTNFYLFFRDTTSSYKVQLGEYYRNLNNEPYPEMNRTIQSIIAHPKYVPSASIDPHNHDLALLKFSEPISFHPNSIPICLPDETELTKVMEPKIKKRSTFYIMPRSIILVFLALCRARCFRLGVGENQWIVQ